MSEKRITVTGSTGWPIEAIAGKLYDQPDVTFTILSKRPVVTHPSHGSGYLHGITGSTWHVQLLGSDDVRDYPGADWSFIPAPSKPKEGP